MNFRPLSIALVLIAGSAHAQDLSKQFPMKGSGPSGAKSSPNKKPKKKLAPQAASALKTPFPQVASAALKGAIPATDLAAAGKAIGKQVTVVGVVDKVFVPGGGSIVLLNFAKDYKKAVTGAIKAKYFGAFPVLATLQGKKVAVSGKMIDYKGKPEVELTKAGSIKLVK